MNAEISEFVSAMCHAHSYAQKPPKTVALYSFDARVKILTEMNCSHQYRSIVPKKSLPRPLQSPQAAHKLLKIVYMNADVSENIKDRKLGF